MYIYRAGVVGAGLMGAQIAQVITASGLPVVIKDQDEGALRQAVDTVRGLYRVRVEKGKMSEEEMEQKMGLLTTTMDYHAFRDVDIVVEAVFEAPQVKRQVLAELDRACSPHTILATNTSALPISALGHVAKRPDKVIGLHFFNPVPAMRLVEVISGLATSPETVEDVVAFSESIRKIPIKVQDCPGFVVNRLLMPYCNEAALALQEGAADVKTIDEALRVFGMPIGPFEVLDLIGLEVAHAVAGTLYDAYGARMEPAPILQAMVAAGRLGKKAGAGFYTYAQGRPDTLQEVIGSVQARTSIRGTPFSSLRLLLPMINEAVICLQEGVAGATDIDMAMMAGTGFPAVKGGPLHYADQLGVDTLLEELERSRRELGPRFWPAPLLKRMVAAGFLGAKAGRGFFPY